MGEIILKRQAGGACPLLAVALEKPTVFLARGAVVLCRQPDKHLCEQACACLSGCLCASSQQARKVPSKHPLPPEGGDEHAQGEVGAHGKRAALTAQLHAERVDEGAGDAAQ